MAASNSPTLLSSEKTVAATQRIHSVTLIAKTGNTNKVYVGGSDAASTTNDGLAAGDALEIVADNWLDLADIFIDVDTNAEGVDFYAVKA